MLILPPLRRTYNLRSDGRRALPACTGQARFLAVLLAAVAALSAGVSRPEPTRIDPPASPGATSPALAVEKATTANRGHDLLMIWLEPGEPGGRLRFGRFSEENWSQPITIAEGVSGLGFGDWPTLTVIDTQAVRRTLIARSGDVVARSGDAGRTWTRLPAPALPFSSFAGGDGGAYAFWLAPHRDGSARLLGTRVLAGETTLDPRVAGGLGTAAAMTWDGPVVVYRDQGAEKSEGIALIRRQDAQWTEPHSVHVEGWRPAKPPKSSPRVTALRRQVAVAWHTTTKGLADGPRVLVAFSSDAGRTFGVPVEVDAKRRHDKPLGPVDIALDDNGQALVLWAAAVKGGEAVLNLARVSPEGQKGRAIMLAEGLPARFEDLPQIVRAGGRVAVAWTEGVPRRLRALSLPLSGIPALGVRRSAGPVANRPSKAYSGRGRVGEPVPDFDLEALDGGKVTRASLQGRAAVLNFWATWCAPCIKEMPELAALEAEFEGDRLAVVGVSVDAMDAHEKVRSFVAQRQIPFAVWLDPEMRLSDALRVRGFPATFIIDREGRIILRRDGAITAADPEIRRALRRALGDP